MKLRWVMLMLALHMVACGKSTEEEVLPEQMLTPSGSQKPSQGSPHTSVPYITGGSVPVIPVETYLVDENRFNPRTSDREILFQFTSNIEGATFECVLGSGEYLPCNRGSSHLVSALNHGKGYVLKARAKSRGRETDATPLEIRFVFDSSHGGPAYGPVGAYGYIPGSSRHLPYPGVPYSGGYGEQGNGFNQPHSGGFPGYNPMIGNGSPPFNSPLNIGAFGTRYGFGSGFPQGRYNAYPGSRSNLGVFNAGPRQVLLGEDDLALIPSNMVVKSYGTRKNLKSSQVYFRLADATNPDCNQSYEVLVKHPSGVSYCEGYPTTREIAEERIGMPIDHLVLEGQAGSRTQEKFVTVINDADATLAPVVDYGSICPNPQREGVAGALAFATKPNLESNQLKWCLLDQGAEGVWWVAQFDAIVPKVAHRERLTAAYMVRANYGGFTPGSQSFVDRAQRFMSAVIMPAGQTSK